MKVGYMCDPIRWKHDVDKRNVGNDVDDGLWWASDIARSKFFHNYDEEGSSKEWKKMGCYRSIATDSPLSRKNLQQQKSFTCLHLTVTKVQEEIHITLWKKCL